VHVRISVFIPAILGCILLASTSPLYALRGDRRPAARLPADELKEYYGLQYLLTDIQNKEYLSLRTARERAQWLERFWLAVDPTPATMANEARMEHQERVAAARQLFGRADPPGWDDRGEILIRFGPPSLRMDNLTSVGMKLPQELWCYDPLNMSVTFTDINPRERFTYRCPQKRLVPQGMPIDPPDEVDYDADRRLCSKLAAMRPCRIWETASIKARHANQNFRVYMEIYSALYASDLEWAPLPCFHDIVSFQGGDRIDRIDVSFEVPMETRAAARQGTARDSKVELGVLVRDDNLLEVASGVGSIEIIDEAGSQKASDLVPGQIVLALKPGRYNVGIEAREPNSKRRAEFKTDVDVPAYKASPCISDIQFSSGITETEESSRFVKGNLCVVPHPQHAYRIPAPIVFYFEIYGLDTDKDGKTFYLVEYRIVPLGKKRWGPVLLERPGTVGASFETSGYGSTQQQQMAIATDELWEGPFRLDVTVTDRRTFRTAARSATFSTLK
jgi:GWxTD domain-containing protein